jgi:PEP-CTERM motif
MMRYTTKLLAIAAAATVTFAATPALADAITVDPSKTGNVYAFSFNGYSGGTTVSGLTGTATFTLTSTTANSYTFNYSVSNTTSSPLTSRISSFAFNTDPNIASATSTGAFSYSTLNSTYPNGIGSVDVCFKDAATGSCAGGGSGGLAQGQTGTGTLTLNFASALSSLTLSDFFNRYQSITGAGGVSSASGTGTLTGSSGGTTTSTSGGTQVPEPGVLGLLGGALLAMGLIRRRRQLVPSRVRVAYA